jgi:hypothetical protein
VTEPEPTLYDELGVDPDVSEELLRAGYRRRALQLHPDVAADADTGEAMRRLNQAWRVLGDADQRRRYDEARARPAAPGGTVVEPQPGPTRAAGDDLGWEAPVLRRRPFLRPSVVVLAVLAVIFVVTAYAGSWPGQQPGAPTATAPRTSVMSPVGMCLAATPASGLNVLVPCSTPNDGQVLAEVSGVDECPPGTVGRVWSLRPTILCTTSSSPSP